MKVFIAEKPSLARQIIQALSINTKEKFESFDGYSKSKNFIVTWCFGHLYELFEIDDYIGHQSKWSEVKLPFIPETFNYKPKQDCKKQIQVIKKLVNDKSTEEIIHSCDADNEGEVIGRICIQKTLVNKTIPITRLWASDTTSSTLWSAYLSRKPDKTYDKQFQSGIARAYADWLLGINCTRALTIKSGELYNIGRVITPIVSKVVSRDKERESFKSKSCWSVNCPYCNAKTEVQTKEQAEVMASLFNSGYEVKKFEQKEKVVPRPKLYSQTTLQNEVSFIGISPDKCLSITQSLYEKGFTTYPRTDSEFLTNGEVDKIKRILTVYGKDYAVTGEEKCFDSSKVASHSAIIPTGKKPTGLNKSELHVYEIIETRFLENFFVEDCIEIQQSCTAVFANKEELNFTGSKIIQKGWLNEKREPKFLPFDLFSVGQHSNSLNWEVVKRTTKKPSLLSVSALNTWCEHPIKSGEASADYSDIIKGLTLGTPATRAGIIKKAIETGYLKLEGNSYHSTSKGRELVRVLEENKIPINTELSVQLQHSITTKSLKEVVEETAELTTQIVRSIQKAEVKKMSKENTTATCLWCGEELVKIHSKDGKAYYTHPSSKNEKGEYVKNTDCQFFIGTTLKYYGHEIILTEKQLDQLMQKGSVVVKGIPSKYGSFKGEMFIEPEPNVWNGKSYIQVNFKKKEYEKQK